MNPNNRILINTIAQYIRTILNMLLSLYSVRLIMDALGVSDYGIYSLVAGVVSLLSFVTNSLIGSTQRFLSNAQGRGDERYLKSVFSNSLLLHIVLGVVIALILASITPLLFNGYLNIPQERTYAAKIVYLQVVVMVYISFIAAPYRALLVSRENIVYTSIIDVLDGVLKVGFAIGLAYVTFDKLIAYGCIMLFIAIFNLLAFVFYSHAHYSECIFPQIKFLNRVYFKQLIGFTGWITYSAICVALRNQGLAIILNQQLGTIVNAAYGLGMQISGMISFVSTSLGNAIAPQLVAAEGEGNRQRMWQLAKVQSKFSFLLLAMIGIPTMFEMKTLLIWWLIEVPTNAVLFACTFLVMQIVDMFTIGLFGAKLAIGNLSKFILITYTPKFGILPIGWIILRYNQSLELICLILILIEFCCMLMRIPLLKNEFSFHIWPYVKEVVLRSLMPCIISFVICLIINISIDSIWRIIITYSVSLPLFAITVYSFSLTKIEQLRIKKLFTNVSKKIKF